MKLSQGTYMYISKTLLRGMPADPSKRAYFTSKLFTIPPQQTILYQTPMIVRHFLTTFGVYLHRQAHKKAQK